MRPVRRVLPSACTCLCVALLPDPGGGDGDDVNGHHLHFLIVNVVCAALSLEPTTPFLLLLRLRMSGYDGATGIEEDHDAAASAADVASKSTAVGEAALDFASAQVTVVSKSWRARAAPREQRGAAKEAKQRQNNKLLRSFLLERLISGAPFGRFQNGGKSEPVPATKGSAPSYWQVANPASPATNNR